MLSDAIIGKKSVQYRLSYTWRDLILYALAVGAKETELELIYEKGLKALPTYGVVPCLSTIGVEPPMKGAADPTILAADFLEDRAGLHMEHELIMYRPIDPAGATFCYDTEVTDLFDRGPGKGAVIKQETTVYDDCGNKICTNNANFILLKGGGFGGKPLPPSPVSIPKTDPDIEIDDVIPMTQNALYRLTGDTNLVHIDPEAARREGQERPFMHGLCSFGYVCRMAAGALFPREPERMTRIAAQMRSVMFPGSSIRLLLWRTDGNCAYFRLVNAATGQAVLDKGVLEWK